MKLFQEGFLMSSLRYRNQPFSQSSPHQPIVTVVHYPLERSVGYKPTIIALLSSGIPDRLEQELKLQFGKDLELKNTTGESKKAWRQVCSIPCPNVKKAWQKAAEFSSMLRPYCLVRRITGLSTSREVENVRKGVV